MKMLIINSAAVVILTVVAGLVVLGTAPRDVGDDPFTMRLVK